MKLLFNIGKLVTTSGALDKFTRGYLQECLSRHIRGDWGDLDPDDRQLNNEAVLDGSRILSSYTDKFGAKLWIITEADRSATTFLLPDEY